MNKSKTIYKHWEDSEGQRLTLTKYNRLAQRACRQSKSVYDYLTELGYTKTWGNKTKKNAS